MYYLLHLAKAHVNFVYVIYRIIVYIGNIRINIKYELLFSLSQY